MRFEDACRISGYNKAKRFITFEYKEALMVCDVDRVCQLQAYSYPHDGAEIIELNPVNSWFDLDDWWPCGWEDV